MSDQDAVCKHLYDVLDEVEATTKQLTGDASPEASEGQTVILDGVNELRYTVGTIPEPTAPTTEERAARSSTAEPEERDESAG